MFSPILLAYMPGLPEIIVILVIILLLFGARRIPEMFKGIGQGIKEFKKATNSESDDKTEQKDEK